MSQTLAAQFRALYESEIGAPFPASLALPLDLEARFVARDGSPSPVLVGTPAAVRDPSLLHGPSAEIGEGYLLAGFWGHGINSHAFYYVSVTDRHRVFVRLPFGNVYADPEREQREVASLVEAWAELVPRLDELGIVHVELYSNMGAQRCEITRADGSSEVATADLAARLRDARNARLDPPTICPPAGGTHGNPAVVFSSPSRWAPLTPHTARKSIMRSTDDSPSALVTREQPQPEIAPILLVEVSTFKLSTRATGVLERLAVYCLGDLVVQPRGAIGKQGKTVDEIVGLLEQLGLELGMDVPGWHEMDHAALRAQHADELARLRDQIRRQQYPYDSSKGIEREIATALRALVSEERARIAEHWIALDRDELPTLEMVGAAHGHSAQRIHQFVTEVTHRAQDAQLEMPRARQALRAIESKRVLAADAMSALLIAEGLAERPISPRGLLRAAEVLGLETRLGEVESEGVSYIGTQADLPVVEGIRLAARRAVEHWGCTTVHSVAEAVNAERGAAGLVPAELARDIITRLPELRWLDDHAGWFWLKNMRNRLVNRIEKVLTIAPRVDIAALRCAVSRDYGMGFAPPTKVVRALCMQLDGCAVEGELVRDISGREPANTLSPTERKFLEVFDEHGPVLVTSELREHLRARDVNDSTFSQVMHNSPILRRVSRAKYALVGATVKPEDVLRAARLERRRRSNIVESCTWSPERDKISLQIRVTEKLMSHGVVGLPREVHEALAPPGGVPHGEFTLRGETAPRFKTNDSALWGFLGFFGRYGGEVGDLLELELVPATRAVTATWREEAEDERDG